MIRQVLIVIVIFIVFNQILYALNDNVEYPSNNNQEPAQKSGSSSTNPQSNSSNNSSNVHQIINPNMFGKPYHVEPGKYIVWNFQQPNPWTQIIYQYGKELPFRFYIKIKIPTLNDYQAWKLVVPNLDFDSKTGEILVPANNEAEALAIANLIIANFSGQLTMENILQNNLLAISISKATNYEMVKQKLRDQIMQTLMGKTDMGKPDFEQDMATNNNSNQTESFMGNEPEAYEGSEYAYL